MRIAFVSSGLEPGADGVGDHIRLLAAEMEREGHTCQLLALNENGPYLYPLVEPGALGTLRLGGGMPWPSRVALAERTLNEFQPDWTSLHFVSYGFDPKGIIRSRIGDLARLFASRPTHVMFHELWAGEKRDAGWKERMVGNIQKKYVLEMVKRIRPRLVTSTNPVHREILRRCGIDAKEYPLFGGVETAAAGPGEWLWQELRSAGVNLPEERGGYWLFGFFGTIQVEWTPEPLFSRIAEAARRCGRRAVMISLGRPGRGGGIWEAMARDYAKDFSFIALGAQPAERVSQVLNALDAGISTMPLELIGKSSTAAAMFEHGLPVIVTRREPFRGVELDAPAGPLICLLDETFPERLMAGLKRAARHSRLAGTASRLLCDLAIV